MSKTLYVAGSPCKGRIKHAKATAKQIVKHGFTRVISNREDVYAKSVRNALRRLGGVKLITYSVKESVQPIEVSVCRGLWETKHVLVVWNGERDTYAALVGEPAVRMNRKIQLLEV